ncbi:MFS transporter [Pseudomonas aeruginosa VRFPA09]|nr:MFS transporter [Pseudomonas aeruginosa VRFPA09]
MGAACAQLRHDPFRRGAPAPAPGRFRPVERDPAVRLLATPAVPGDLPAVPRGDRERQEPGVRHRRTRRAQAQGQHHGRRGGDAAACRAALPAARRRSSRRRGLVAFLGALAFMLFYRTPPDAPAPGANPAERDLGAVVKSRLAMITDPAMKNIVCSGVALISVQYGILVFTVLYLHETLEIGIGMAATLLFVAQGCGVAGRILLAAWSDRCRAGRYFPVMVCLGAVILGLLALVLLPLQSPLGMGLVVAWLGFFGFGWYGPWVAYVADTAPVGKTGFALGLAMAINQLAIVLAPPALGLLKDFSHSFVPGWLALCLMAAVALVVTAWSGRGLPTALPQKH